MLTSILDDLQKKISQKFSKTLGSKPISVSKKDLQGFYEAQSLALKCAKDVASELKVGWTEKQAADLLNTALKDNGVQNFFHYSYAWFGERTKFSGITRKNYFAYMPSERVLLEGEPFILDVAPIVDGYICDIGYSSCQDSSNHSFNEAIKFLDELRQLIPNLFLESKVGYDIWNTIDQKIKDSGYDNIHKLYPFSVLGHRVHKIKISPVEASLANFGWHSYFAFLKRGLYGELLGPDYEGNVIGAWAIEPHIAKDNFGCKFEEILIVEKNKAYWLKDYFENKEQESK